jgi:hypothetical protein
MFGNTDVFNPLLGHLFSHPFQDCLHMDLNAGSTKVMPLVEHHVQSICVKLMHPADKPLAHVCPHRSVSGYVYHIS